MFKVSVKIGNLLQNNPKTQLVLAISATKMIFQINPQYVMQKTCAMRADQN
jgi:hypothetical protein